MGGQVGSAPALPNLCIWAAKMGKVKGIGVREVTNDEWVANRDRK